MKSPSNGRPVLVLIVGLAISLLAASCGSETLSGYERSPEPAVGSITLPLADDSGDRFAFKADPGELLLVYFGFASCPDICPTTLADTRLALNTLGARAEEVDVAFVTIDPQRDDNETTSGYIGAFVEGGIGLRTDDKLELLEAAEAFGVSYQVAPNDAGEVEVGHTSHMFAVDSAGDLKLTWPFGTTHEDMASDLSILLSRQ